MTRRRRNASLRRRVDVRTARHDRRTGQAELVARARQGDQEAFEQLVRATYADDVHPRLPADRQRGGREGRGRRSRTCGPTGG